MSTFAVVAGDWPVSQGYGATDFGGEPAGHGFPHWHEGIDIACPDGTSCLAPVTGQVVIVLEGALVIQDATGARLYYFHIDHATVAVGDEVKPGQEVAISDTKAVSGGVTPTGPHLHFGVRLSPYRYQVDDVDPGPWLNPPPPPAPPPPEPGPGPEDSIVWQTFAGTVAVDTANVHGSYGLEAPVIYKLPGGTALTFDGWVRHGQPIPDAEGTPTAGEPDNIWFHISPTSDTREGWIASAIVNGGPF